MNSSDQKKKIAIVGGGPAALLLAAFLDENIFDVTIFEKNKTAGRKFLVAGKGGFNLTHSEDINSLNSRYTPVDFLKPSLLEFTNNDFRAWLEKIGIPTFVGSSKRIYPRKGIKPIQVLQAIIDVLIEKKVQFEYGHAWTGWTDKNELVFNVKKVFKSDYVVFALGGGSWKVTGSDGKWMKRFAQKGISIVPFQSANCAFKIQWPKDFLKQTEGHPLKNISLSCLGVDQMGELVITKFGLEGGPIYALSSEIQGELKQNNQATIYLDLKPTISEAQVLERLHSSGRNTSDILRNTLKLSAAQILLLKAHVTKEEFLSPEVFANKIKRLPLVVTEAAAVDEAISTTGGVDLSDIDQNFQLNKLPQQYCIGEMLDWNAPTGGYLLQACASMGVKLAKSLNFLEG